MPETPEWDKAMSAQAHAETLQKFIVWIQYHKGIDICDGKSIDELMAEFFDIDIDMLMMEEELMHEYHILVKEEINRTIF